MLSVAWTSVPACYRRDREEGLSRSGQENQWHHEIHGAAEDWGYREELIILETTYFLVNNLDLYYALPRRCCLSSLSSISLGMYIHWMRAPGTRYSVPVTSIASLFMIQDDHISFLKQTNTFPSDLLHILSTRLIIIHRAGKLHCIEATICSQLPHIGGW